MIDILIEMGVMLVKAVSGIRVRGRKIINVYISSGKSSHYE